ncbi:MAG: 23S rRNA (guanosine(2251)-2'-O)-methyltransferase RlmB [Gammaproteobacteria bacterium]|nr:23S rRNA (guanosine(2251)-2'-O)-methyltransferase RlmB [Gammaproteobacteria bacterium]
MIKQSKISLSNFYGIHVANILLDKYPESIIAFYIQDSFKKDANNHRINSILAIASQYGLAINYVPKTKLEQLADSVQHQGIVVQCKANTVLKLKAEDQLKDFYQSKVNQNNNHKFFILILDGIQDPHNLGACLRSAEVMGVDCVIMPQSNSAPLNNTVCKISSGAALLIPVFQVVNLARAITWLKEQGVWVYGTAVDCNNKINKINKINKNKKIIELELTDSIALIMGAEGDGMRKLTKDLCDQLFTIPMMGSIESLNVSVATGICLYETARQRRFE